MMEDKKTIFDYLGETFSIYGITIVLLNIFCVVFGEVAKPYSQMFAFGSKALSIKTMVEFFVVSIGTVIIQFIFCSDRVVKRLSAAFRMAGMLITLLCSICVMIVLCDWFPINMWQPWAMFFLCFGLSVGVSVSITSMRQKAMNQKMKEALKRIKEGE